MQAITTVGLDIAKSVFQVHGVDADGNVILRRQLKRRYVLLFFQKLSPCLVGVEACATSHYWSRELQALGHKVRLMPPAYVKPYVDTKKSGHFEKTLSQSIPNSFGHIEPMAKARRTFRSRRRADRVRRQRP